MISDDFLEASGYFLTKTYKATKFWLFAAGAFIAASLALLASPILICCCGDLIKGDIWGKGEGVGLFWGMVALGIIAPVVIIPLFPFVAAGSLALGIGTAVLGIASWMVEKICGCGARDADAPPLLSQRERAEAHERQARVARQQEAQRLAEVSEQARRVAAQREEQRREGEQKSQHNVSSMDRVRLSVVGPSAPVFPPTPSAPPAFWQREVQEFKSEFFPSGPVKPRRAIPLLKSPLTDAQINIMTEKLTPETREIFDAAMVDNVVTLTEMHDPVFISDGYNYDRATVAGLLLSGLSPIRQPFKEEDIVPNNTLAKAMLFLIDDIQKEVNGQRVIRNYDIDLTFKPALKAQAQAKAKENEEQAKKRTELTELQKEQAREVNDRCLLDDDVKALKVYYQQLPPRQKQAFDIMCKDPLTGRILKNPIFLPDGYVYDRTTIQAYCAQFEMTATSWPCPQNTAVQFTKEQILKCFSARNVLDVLKRKIPQIKLGIEEAQVNRRMTA